MRTNGGKDIIIDISKLHSKDPLNDPLSTTTLKLEGTLIEATQIEGRFHRGRIHSNLVDKGQVLRKGGIRMLVAVDDSTIEVKDIGGNDKKLK